MEIYLILKIIFILSILLVIYAVIKNLDIIKIIFSYWKDLIFRK